MKLNLDSKRIAVFGLPGEGKSNFTGYLLSQYGARGFVYDTMHEYPANAKFDLYRPHGRYDVDELIRCLKLVVKTKKYKLIAIDEANRFMPSKPHPLPDYIAELNDCCRHPEYGNFTPLYIARRPTMLNQDLTELCHYLVIFNLKGKNDIDYLNDYAGGLGDAVFKLPKYHFIIVDQRREYKVHKPIPLQPLKKS